MAYDEKLAERIRARFVRRRDLVVVEQQMFGGLAFMVHGHMACGCINDDLMVRTGPEQYEAALARPHVRPMDFTGKPLKGLVYVGPRGLRTSDQLGKWVDLGCAVAATLPEKPPAKIKPAKPAAKVAKPRR